MSVEVRGVQVLEHPPDGRLRQEGTSHLKSQGVQVGGGQVGGARPFRHQAAISGQHCRQVTVHAHRSRGRSRSLTTWARGWRDKAVVVEDDMAA